MRQTNELLAQFKERLEAVGGEAHSVDSLEQATEIIVAHPALTQKEIVVAPDFATYHPWSAILLLLRDKDISIRVAELAIAETGSVFLAENALEARVVGMLTLTYFVLVRKETLFPMLEDA